MNTHLELQEINSEWTELQLQDNCGFNGQEEQVA